jgi:hypothetical protein
MKQRKGMGKGKGSGWKNMRSDDSHRHSLASKGIKSAQKMNPQVMNMITKWKAPKGKFNEDNVELLELFVSNSRELWYDERQPKLLQLEKKKAQGIYDHELAVKSMYGLATDGAKLFKKENPDSKIDFEPADRLEVAKRLTDEFETEYEFGNRIGEFEKTLKPRDKKTGIFKTLRGMYNEIDKRGYRNIEGLKAEITEKQYDDNLNILPPLKWQGGTFYMSEFLTGDLTTKFSRDKKTGKYYAEVVDFRKEFPKMSDEEYMMNR